MFLTGDSSSSKFLIVNEEGKCVKDKYLSSSLNNFYKSQKNVINNKFCSNHGMCFKIMQENKVLGYFVRSEYLYTDNSKWIICGFVPTEENFIRIGTTKMIAKNSISIVGVRRIKQALKNNTLDLLKSSSLNNKKTYHNEKEMKKIFNFKNFNYINFEKQLNIFEQKIKKYYKQDLNEVWI